MTDQPGSAPAGNPTFDWSTSLGQNYETHKPLIETKGWKGPGDVLTGYSELEKLVGQNKIAVPGKDAKPEDWRKVFTTLGMPNDASGYDLQAPTDFEGYDQNVTDWFRGAAHKVGLTGAQAKALYDEYINHSRSQYNAMGEAATNQDKELDAALRTKWGVDYDKNIAIAQSAAKAFGVKAEQADVLEKIIGSPALLEMFANIGEKMGTASLVNGGIQNNPSGAIAEINRVKADPDFMKAWTNREHPGHQEAVARMNSLNERAYPNV